MQKVLITGINGFVGKHLISGFKDSEIVGLTRADSSETESAVRYVSGDILDKERIEAIIQDENPSIILHLAALTSPSESLKDPIGTLNNNIQGQLNIFEAIRNLDLLSTKILTVSSAEVYGSVDESELPISEKSELRPNTPYGVSKVAQDLLGYQYFVAYGVQNIRVRPFNHIGPGQSDKFVVSQFAKQIAMIEKGQQEPIVKVGNLSPKRDFTDVRDIVNAYRLIMQSGKIGEVYNIGSNKSYAISEILDILSSFSDIEISVEVDANLVRKVDAIDIRCDYNKVKNDTGWEPKIGIEKSLKDTLDYWRDIL